MKKQYGQPFHLSGLHPESEATALTALPYVVAKEQVGARYDENWLQQLIATHPEILPYAELGEPTFATATSICTELPIEGKYVDNLLATERGGIVLVECKLWRNPEARRSVIGQILDYATELSKWDYEKLDAAIRRAKPPKGVSREDNFYSRAKSPDGLEERDFVDVVAQNLKRGRLLLLVIGDGIREGVESMAGFLQSHAGLRFTLGVAEMAVYKLPTADHYITQARVLARTVKIERGVVVLSDDKIHVQPPADATKSTSAARTGLDISTTISEEMMFERLNAKEPGMGSKLQAFIQKMEPAGVFQELTPVMMKLIGRANDDLWLLCSIDLNGTVWFEGMANVARAAGRHEDGLKFYRALVDLLDDENLRRQRLAPGTRTGTRSLPLSLLLQKTEQWESAIENYLRTVAGPAS
jgi:hypothetical protein